MNRNQSYTISKATKLLATVGLSWLVLKCFKVSTLSWGLTLAPLLLIVAAKLFYVFIFIIQELINKKTNGKV